MKNKKLTTYQMAVTALMAAALCVLGPLSVPIGAIPISLSNFVICLTVWLLGPKFGGKGMYGSRVHQAVIASHEKKSGITIHYINEQYDEGNTIFQATCPVLPTDTPDTLATRVHQLEYEYFPRVIEATILGKNLSI